MSDLRPCPSCGREVHSTKIKCNYCGQMLNVPPPHDATGSEGGEEQGTVILRGEDARAAALHPEGQHGADFNVDTRDRRIVNITERVASFARGVGESGLVHVFVPHATAGVAIMETGAGSEADLSEALDRLFPPDDRYAHRHGSPGHGRSHVVPAFVAPFTLVPVDHGRLLLGEWQSIVLVDPNQDNPDRKVILTFLPGRD